MPKLTMLVGASGSGKTTFARVMLADDPNTIRLNRDELRLMALHKWRGSTEDFIIQSEKLMAAAAAKRKYNIVVDDTNLTPGHEKFWKDLAKEIGYTFDRLVIPTSLEDCVDRDLGRKDHTHIGRPAIERQFLRGKLVKWDPTKQVVIFDIDGTLADLTHRVPWITVGAPCPACKEDGAFFFRGKGCLFCNGTRKIVKKRHDIFYSLCDKDKPIDVVICWAQECKKYFTVLIVSGRSPENGTAEKTMSWLKHYGVEYDHIYMRRPFNHGVDTIEKQLILDELLASGLAKEMIAFVVDDRPSVIKMWKDNGLRVIPVRGRDDDAFYEQMAELEKDHPSLTEA
jgi:predicted kinase